MTQTKKLLLTVLALCLPLAAFVNQDTNGGIEEYVVTRMQGDGIGFFKLSDDSFERLKINQLLERGDIIVVSDMNTELEYRDYQGNKRKLCPQNSPHLVREFPTKSLVETVMSRFSVHVPEAISVEVGSSRSSVGKVNFLSIDNNFVANYSSTISWHAGKPPFKVLLKKRVSTKNSSNDKDIYWEKAGVMERTLDLQGKISASGEYVLIVSSAPSEASTSTVNGAQIVTELAETTITIFPALPYAEFSLPQQLTTEPVLEKFLFCRAMSKMSSWKEFAVSYCSERKTRWILESTYDELKPSDNLCP